MSSTFGNDFVHGWPKKHCGCDQIIEPCLHCSGSYFACPNCVYCQGLAYVEARCPHSHQSLEALAPLLSAHEATPSPYESKKHRGTPDDQATQAVGTRGRSESASTASSSTPSSKSVPSSSMPLSPSPRRRSRYPSQEGSPSPSRKGQRGSGNRDGSHGRR